MEETILEGEIVQSREFGVEIETPEIEDKEFQDSVNTYKEEEKKVVRSFIHGMTHLGRILAEQRDIWKPKSLWLKYLSSVNVSPSGANKMINIYEYSKLHIGVLEQAGVDNWKKVDAFLTLPDDLKETFADNIAGESLGTTEFIQEAETLHKTEYDVKPLTADPISESADEMLKSALIGDIPLMAERLIEELERQGVPVTMTSLPGAEAYLMVSKVFGDISAGSFEGMDKVESTFWLKKLRQKAYEISKLKKIK